MTVLCADIELTRRCDLRCPTCFVRAQPDAHAELPLDTVVELLDQLPPRRTVVHLTGGEPLLYPHLDAVLECAGAIGFRDGVINTHGRALDDRRADRIADSAVPWRLLVSLDGPPGRHDRARGAGMTDAARAAIARARERGIGVTVASVLTRDLVAAGLAAWHAWLTETLGARLPLALYPLFVAPGRDTGRDAIGLPLGPEDLHAAADELASMLRAGEPVSVADYPLLNVLLARRGVPRRRLHQCDAGRGRFCLQADGSISPCHPCRHPLLPAGPNLLARLARDPVYRTLGRREFERCAACDERSICGHCRAVVTGKGHGLFADDGWCALVRG